MYGRQSTMRQFSIGGDGSPPPRDIVVLLAVLFVTFSMQFFASLAWLPQLLHLTPRVWSGWLWQLATYPYVASGPGVPIFFLLALLITFWFGRDVFRYLGRRGFWKLLAWATITAAVVAVVVELLLQLLGWSAAPSPFGLMQGEHMLLAVLIAAFATVYGDATILLFFVLPLRARWFLWIEIVLAFTGFLTTKDFAGFVGICTGVGMTYSMLTAGGLGRLLRETRLRLEKLVIQARLGAMDRRRRKRGMRIVKPDEDGDVRRGPWVN